MMIKQTFRVAMAVAALAGAATTVGCAGHKQAPATKAQSDAKALSEAMARGAYVAKGTEFDIRLKNGIGSETSYAGQPIAAAVLRPLRMANGEILVRAGSDLIGHVVSLDRSAEMPALQIQFDSIGTESGPARLNATLGKAQHGSLAMTQVFGPGIGYDAIIVRRAPPAPAVGGGPRAPEPANRGGAPEGVPGSSEANAPPSPEPAAARSLQLPAGSELRVVLTEVLPKAPGSSKEKEKETK
jgi:hypothetical protein